MHARRPVPNAATQRIIWMAMLSTPLILLVPVFFVFTPVEDMDQTLLAALLGGGLLQAIASLVLPVLLRGKMPTYQMRIFQWALAESCGVLAVPLAALGAPVFMSAGLAVVSFVLIALSPPLASPPSA